MTTATALTPLQQKVLDQLRKDLQTERVLNEQLHAYIIDHFNIEDTRLADFFTQKLSEIEDYEADLALSPLFTPTHHDRIRYTPLLGEAALSPAEVNALVDKLNNESLTGRYLTFNGLTIRGLLHPVSIDRYVKRLFLDKTVDADVYQRLQAVIPSASLPHAMAWARDDVWQSMERKALLQSFLSAFEANASYSDDKLSFLTDFIRTYRPNTVAEVCQHLDSLIRSCEADMDNLEGRMFHDEQLKQMYEDSETTQDQEHEAFARYQHMKEQAQQLQADCKGLM